MCLTAFKKLRDYTRHVSGVKSSELRMFFINIPVVVPSLFIVGVELGFATWLPSMLSIRYSAQGALVRFSVTIFSVFMGLGRALLGRISDSLGAVKSITFFGGCAGLSFLVFASIEDFPASSLSFQLSVWSSALSSPPSLHGLSATTQPTAEASQAWSSQPDVSERSS
ncbi:MAG: hypothetical protein QXY50_05870 [Candidatus Caldarchaeum sp.]